MKTSLLGSTFTAALLLGACATDTTTTPGDDELAGEQNDGEAAKADGVDTFGMFTAQKIGAFECNGAGSCTHVELIRANRSTTTCADGKTAASCSVRTLDFSKAGLSATKLTAVTAALQASASTPEIGAQLLIKGVYVHGTNPSAPGVDWVTFQVSDVWLAQLAGGTLDGTLVLVQDNNIRCITTPCPTVTETRINSTRAANTMGLDWNDEAVQSTSSLHDKVATAMAKGVIVSGFRTHDANATYRSVEQVFLKQ